MIDFDTIFLLFIFFFRLGSFAFFRNFCEVSISINKTNLKMKPVLVFVLACVAVALAVPIADETANDGGAAPIALEDVAQDSTAVSDSSNTELVRPKRFLLKKLALAKAGVLGLGLVLNLFCIFFLVLNSNAKCVFDVFRLDNRVDL